MKVSWSLPWSVGLVAALALPSALASCGGGTSGDSSGSSCGNVEPCGGDVTGDWKATGACVNLAAAMISVGGSCPQLIVTSASGNATGQLSLTSDLSYSSTVGETIVLKVTAPVSCAAGGTCDDLATSLLGSGANAATCIGTDSCACSLTFQMDLADTGTYSTAGTTLTLTSGNGGAGPFGDYCVQSGTLHLVDVDTTTNLGPMGQATIDDDLVLQKQ
jgi:hypothetical protein